MPYFCAKLLVVCLVNPGKPRQRNTYDTPFVLIRATNHAQAFKTALVLGKRQETKGAGVRKGETVRWAFVRVEEIKKLPVMLHGVEGGSVLDSLGAKLPLPYNKRFYPERHTPFLT